MPIIYFPPISHLGLHLKDEDINKPPTANRTTTYRYLVFITGLVFIGYLFWQSRALISQRIPTIQGWLFVLSMLIAFTCTFATSLYFYKLLQKYRQNIGLRLNLEMFYFGQLAKYIPGKIWSVVFQGLLGQGHIKSSAIILSNIDLTVMQINVTMVIGLCVILALSHSFWLVAIIFLTGMVASHYLSKSCLSEHFLVYISRWFKRLANYKLACEPSFTWWQSISFFLVILITFATSHVCLLVSVFGFNLNEGLFYTGLIALSWVIGMITMISPAGMGIRELVFIILAKLATQQVDDSTLAAIATISRVWLIFQDILSAGLLYTYIKFGKNLIE